MPARSAFAGRVSGGATSLGSVVALALAPKCPLCVAAALSALGFGAAGAGVVAPYVRPAGGAVAALALVVFAWSEWRRLRARRLARNAARGCCARVDDREP